MSDNIIQISNYKPHVEGDVKCLNCNYKWVAVAPTGTHTLECPECGLIKGVFVYLVVPDVYWKCECGNDLFFLTIRGGVCSKCGILKEGDWYE